MLSALNQVKLYLRSARKVRRLPRLTSCQILAVDNGIEYLKECFPTNATYFHLPIRGEVFYLNRHIFISLSKFLILKRRNGFGLRGCYVAAVAKHLKPKVIVTMIDNNNWDTNLSANLNIPIICIGNGFRLPPQIEGKHFDSYFALSTAPIDNKLPFNCSIDDFHAVGHLKMGIYQEKYWGNEPESVPEKPILLWISQFREFIYSSSQAIYTQQKQTELMSISFMSRFASHNNYLARVAIASERKKQNQNLEVSLFESAATGEIQFSGGYSDEWVSYHEVKNATLVLGMTSTLLFESLSVDKRVIFMLPDDFPDMLAHAGQAVRLDLIEPLRFSDTTYERFAEHCKQILSMSDTEYMQLIGPIQKHVAPFNKSCLPHHQIQNKIKGLLSA